MRHILQNIQIRPGAREITPCARTYRPQRCHISLQGRDSQRGWRNILWHYVPVAFPLTTPFFILSSLPSVTPHHKSSPGRGVTDCPSAVPLPLTGVSPSPDSYCLARARGTRRGTGSHDRAASPGLARELRSWRRQTLPGPPVHPVRPSDRR